MKIATYTTHSIVPVNDDDDTDFEVFVDSDGTVQVKFCNDDARCSPWLGRDDLMALRRAITKALRLIP